MELHGFHAIYYFLCCGVGGHRYWNRTSVASFADLRISPWLIGAGLSCWAEYQTTLISDIKNPSATFLKCEMGRVILIISTNQTCVQSIFDFLFCASV